MGSTRRQFVYRGGVLAAGAPALASAEKLVDASKAKSTRALSVLSPDEADTLAGFSETLVPGAKAAGIVDYIDSQLASDGADSLLMLRYLVVPLEEFAGFYQAGLASCLALAKAKFDGKSWSALNTAERLQLVELTGSDAAPEWAGPPASFFQFVVRADACDVVYGTRAGFERMGMPHMSHINPASEW